MNNTGKEKNTNVVYNKVFTVVISATVIFLLVFSTFMSKNGINVNFFGYTINPTSLNGVICQIAIILVVALRVSVDSSAGACFFLAIFYLMLSCSSVIMSRTLTPLPGVFTSTGLIIILLIINLFIKRIKKNEDELVAAANTDFLTGIPNRRSLINELSSRLEKDEHFILIILEISNFKTINDILGHDSGDEVIKKISDILCAYKNDKNFFSRLEGCEFAIISIHEADSEFVQSSLRRIIDDIKKQTHDSKKKLFAEINIGIVDSEMENDESRLLAHADMAMYNARKSNDHIQIYDPSMEDRLNKSAELNSMIVDALKDERFFVMYQPQYHADTKKLRGFESLVRMRGKDGNIISPGLFIPAAEKNGHITDIDRFVLRKALNTFKPVVSGTDITVSVNMSVADIRRTDFVDMIRTALEDEGYPAKNLEIEITESMLIDSLDDVIEKLKQLRALGIQVALDDFGTGFASLSYLKNLPVDLLKIDKAFIDHITDGEEDKDFVDAIISMGHILHFTVISEGVEVNEQLEALKDLGCDLIQGYIWGKPLDTDKALEVVKAG